MRGVSKEFLWALLIFLTAFAIRACGAADKKNQIVKSSLIAQRLRGQAPEKWRVTMVYADGDNEMDKFDDEDELEQENEYPLGSDIFLRSSKPGIRRSGIDPQSPATLPVVEEPLVEVAIRLGIDGTDGILIPLFFGNDESEEAGHKISRSVAKPQNEMEGMAPLRDGAASAARTRTVVRSYRPSFRGSGNGSPRIKETTGTMWALPRDDVINDELLRRAPLMRSREHLQVGRVNERHGKRRAIDQQGISGGTSQGGLIGRRDVKTKLKETDTQVFPSLGVEQKGRLRRRTAANYEAPTMENGQFRYNRFIANNLIESQGIWSEGKEHWRGATVDCLIGGNCSDADLREVKFLRKMEI